MSVQAPYPSVRQARPIIFPLLLIAVGVTLLLLNLGYISWESVRSVLRFWPVIFIALGIEALVTRRVPWGALVLAILVTLVFSSSGWMRMPPWRAQQSSGQPAPIVQNQSLNGASRAVVDLTTGGAHVNLGPLHDSGMLASWQSVEPDPPSYRVRDGVGRLELKLGHGRGFPGLGVMNPFLQGADPGGTPDPSQISVQLATGIPLEVEAHIGASEVSMDLRELQVNRLTLDAGASNGTIYLPSVADSTAATIRGGASNLELVVPDGVRARITSEGGLSSLHVDPTRFGQADGNGNVYQSLSADPGAHTLELALRLGASSVNVR